MEVMLRPEDIKIECVADRPNGGMWHNGPNPSWVTVTHLPTMISARAYGHSQHKARQAATACVEMMVEASREERCSFPERVGGERQVAAGIDDTPAKDLTDEQIASERKRIGKIIDAGFGDHGGSPGEWYYERSDELDWAARGRGLI